MMSKYWISAQADDSIVREGAGCLATNTRWPRNCHCTPTLSQVLPHCSRCDHHSADYLSQED